MIFIFFSDDKHSLLPSYTTEMPEVTAYGISFHVDESDSF